MTGQDLYLLLARELSTHGASFVACGDLSPLPPDVRSGLPVGISIGMALRPDVLADIAAGPTRQYGAECDRVRQLLPQLRSLCIDLLARNGWRAMPSPSGVCDPANLASRLPHKTVATLAGAGWIGKCALLVTPRFGSAVRLTSVLTDADLPLADAVTESRCGPCDACVRVCPARAVRGSPWYPGLDRRRLLDAHACDIASADCAKRTGLAGHICDRCIAVCPWTDRYLSGTDPRPETPAL
jgi:epoxyqueuosine reductase